MKIPRDYIAPNPDAFEMDPLGYSALAWHKWGMVQTLAGFPVDLEKGPSTVDLKSPVLWLTHAHAMSEAARILLKDSPNLEPMPLNLQGICHCQYHAVALMLVGYSLEICLKAMLIIKKGINAYQEEERKHRHHSLEKLAEFIPDLSKKDNAILRGLSHFVQWAGRYPDPGFGRQGHATEIFSLAEDYQISAKELFQLAARIMGQTRVVIGEI